MQHLVPRMGFVVVVACLLLLLPHHVAAGTCSPFTNGRTGEVVDPSTWPTTALNLQGSGSSPIPLTFDLNWCQKANLAGGRQQPCAGNAPPTGYVQAFGTTTSGPEECYVSYHSLTSPPAMNSNGNNEVIIGYGGITTSGSSFILNIMISCDGATDYSFTGSTYSTKQVGPSLGFEVRLTSKYACGGAAPAAPARSKGLSGGGVFLILVFVGGGVYAIIHLAINALVRGKRGTDVIPDAWKAFPGLVKDGFSFTGSKLRGLCNKGAYNTV